MESAASAIVQRDNRGFTPATWKWRESGRGAGIAKADLKKIRCQVRKTCSAYKFTDLVDADGYPVDLL